MRGDNMHPKICMQDVSKNVHSRYPLVGSLFAPYALPKSVLLHCISVD
jgi:hypothetical protein